MSNLQTNSAEFTASTIEQSATLKPDVSGNTLISDEYAKTQRELHATGTYGTAAKAYGGLVTQIIDRMGVTHLLDYGCGSRLSLFHSISPKAKLTYQAYDPGTEDFAEEPVPAQMVCCIDVLEHIEPEYLESVLDHLCSLTEVIAFITIHTGPAVKVLSDGRNAHLTQQPMEWWLPKLWSRWDLQTMQVTGENAFHVIGMAKPRLEARDGKRIV